ncbi:hypothetical protein RIF29_12025 [Crotalaria pallida]|uniref:Uncharacterized protein n=1 Tax=Crotalaria pallida TaxID=3830 RepID=A0AAN9IN07_CROPI
MVNAFGSFRLSFLFRYDILLFYFQWFLGNYVSDVEKSHLQIPCQDYFDVMMKKSIYLLTLHLNFILFYLFIFFGEPQF